MGVLVDSPQGSTIPELHCCEEYSGLFWSSCSSGCAAAPLSSGMLEGGYSQIHNSAVLWGSLFIFVPCKMNPQVVLAIPEGQLGLGGENSPKSPDVHQV